LFNDEGEQTMNRIRLLAFGATLMFALTAAAQQPSTAGVQSTHSVPTVEAHLKVLAEKLDLTTDQQAKAKPILQAMHDSWQKVEQDESLSHEDRMNRKRPAFEKADKQLREILNDDQRKKLDQIEQEQHGQSHGSAN
jgi:hypothetical protein